MKKLIAAVLVATVSTAVFAFDYPNDVAQSIPLKDGATVHVFADGKMAMEDKFGRATSMADGQAMEASDGRQIIMHGNEVGRLGYLLALDQR